MYPNFEAEKARRRLTNREISKGIGMNYDTFSRKMRGDSPITLHEAFKVQEKYFPEKDLPYLFSNKTA